MNPKLPRRPEHAGWRLRFPKEVSPLERLEVSWALEQGLVQENRILEAHSRVKRFYKVPGHGICFFVKVRDFHSWSRRLGRALRRTKEEQELANYELLRCSGVPCPRAMASARLQKRLLPQASALVTQFLQDVLPLKELLMGPQGFLLLEPLVELWVLLREARIVHQDLQWENILTGSPQEGFPLYLVDPLHVRPMQQGKDEQNFAMSLAWFLGFMIRGGAPRELVALLAKQTARLGLCTPWDTQELLLRAEKIWAP